MRIDLLIRSARRAARLSQRDVAERAGIPRSVIGRIESGATADPGIGVVSRIFAVTACRVLVVDRRGRELTEARPDDELRDRGGRRYPAHLPLYPIELWDSWWGWFRIAWWMTDPAVPRLTYDRRRRSLCYSTLRWFDAT